MKAPDNVLGADRLLTRFGFWPSFHDAEVVRVALDRNGTNGPTAELTVHTWSMTDRVDERGRYVLENHTLVRFLLERVLSTELVGFNHQNVLAGIEFSEETIEGQLASRMTLHPCYGLAGSFVCNRIVVADVTPSDEHGQAVR